MKRKEPRRRKKSYIDGTFEAELEQLARRAHPVRVYYVRPPACVCTYARARVAHASSALPSLPCRVVRILLSCVVPILHTVLSCAVYIHTRTHTSLRHGRLDLLHTSPPVQSVSVRLGVCTNGGTEASVSGSVHC